jgi:hypothetical protein
MVPAVSSARGNALSPENKNVLIFFVCVNAIGFLLMGLGRLRKWLRRRRAESWVLVEGHIETHDAQPHTTMKGRSYFEAAVGYSYYFQGEYYSGLHSLGTVGSVEDADTKSQRFPIGTPVNVLVNPDRPEESLLPD